MSSIETGERREEFIISSPAMISGIYTDSDLEIRHMENHPSFPCMTRKNFFVIRSLNDGSDDVIFSESSDIKVAYRLRYEVAEVLCTIFSVFFGKRFDFHSPLKSSDDTYRLPQLNEYPSSLDLRLPTNTSKERIDKFLPMNWEKIQPIFNLLYQDEAKTRTFLEAGNLYKKALINIDYDPEIAYFDLVRVLEILGGDLNKEEETEFTGDLKEIYDFIKHDRDTVKKFRLYHGTGKKIRKMTLGLIDNDPDFRYRTESSGKSRSKLKKKDRENALVCVYDIRSAYVHEGKSFGHSILPFMIKNLETGLIEGLDEIAGKTPTFLGLERIVRRALIQYITKA